jgi:glycosyltransferase involved in cell wall biosynthesis
MKSYEFDNERLDGIVRLMEFYYNNGLHFMVVSLYEKFKNVNVGNFASKIFYDDSVYSKFNYYNQISGCYADGKKSAYDSCKYLCLNNAPDWMKFNAMNNMVFYKDHFERDENNKDFIKYLIKFLQTSVDKEKNKIIWSYSRELIKKHFPETHDRIECDFKIVNIKKDDSYKKSKKILIYTGPMYHDWNYNDFLYKSLGGSEKAVVYLSNNLPKEYEIYISGMVKEESFGNISYVNEQNLQKLIDENNFHTIIVSRYACFINRFQNIKCFQLFISLHDTCILSVNGIDVKKCIYYNIDKIDGVVVLTKTHKKMIRKQFSRLKDKMHIINNGIELDAFKDNKIGFKVKNSFIWSSCSERGLDILLGLWEEILIKMPDATLEICSYDTFPKTENDTRMLEIITKHSSVTHRGKLNKNDLYTLMEQTEYWLYTCTFPETSCITALEMLASNIVCIYYPVAALVDTLGDYGIPVNRGEEIDTLMVLTEEKKRAIRIRGKAYAKSCSWKHRYKKWEKMLRLKKPKWIFYCPQHFEKKMIQQYIDNLNYIYSEYDIYLSNDKKWILTENPPKITFVFEMFDELILNKLPDTHFSFLNTESLNIPIRLMYTIGILKLYTDFGYYDYSQSNLKILEENGFNIEESKGVMVYLPYKCNENELDLLTSLNKKTKKEFDFGILKASGDVIPRRLKIINFLKKNNVSVNSICGWGNDRDVELAKCKIILNIHGFDKIPSNIFEHIPYNRLLEAGFDILSETSYKLDQDFVNKYPNLKQIEYSDFFNIAPDNIFAQRDE